MHSKPTHGGPASGSRGGSIACKECWVQEISLHQEFQKGVDLASFKSGGGDDIYVLFSKDGVIIKGFDHESDFSPYARDDHSPWPGMFDGVPPNLLRLLNDPAICKNDITFLHWLPADQSKWVRAFPNEEEDGSGWLPLLPIRAKDYIDKAQEYFQKGFEKIDPQVIYRHFGG